MENKDKGMLHTMAPTKTKTSLSTSVVIGIVLLAILLGTGTGFLINKFSGASMQASTSGDGKSTGDSPQTAGVLDKKTFTDKAEGVLREGGIEGEGNFHLERPGGKDQTAYLTSTAVDLTKFIGKKVRVWGQTYEAEKAGWLMDVGYVEIIK